jgi:general secretion pathway protein G
MIPNTLNRPFAAPLTMTSLSCAPRAPRRNRSHRGFTLIELLVVITIIARRTAARTDVNTIMQSLQRYKLDNQRFPTAEQGLAALVTKPSANPIPPNWRPYMPKLPNDPWGAAYQYANPGVKGDVDVFSLGADGKPGGEGNDADIGSWQ